MKQVYALAAILGGVLWVGLNLALVGAWERGNTFPTYELVNGLRPVPLALLAFALYGLYQQLGGNVGRRGCFVALAGFFLLAAGAALEFWVGGGVRDGEVDTLSLAGWSIYLLGYLVLSIGLVMFGVAVRRAKAWGDASVLPLVTAVVWVAWFPLVIVDQLAQSSSSDITQYVFGLLWIALGVLMMRNVTRAPHETVPH